MSPLDQAIALATTYRNMILMIDDLHYHCLICAEMFAVDEIENHVIEEHPEAMEVFPEFDVGDFPFVELI